jgi:branched-chain amino acid transport system permease protein
MAKEVFSLQRPFSLSRGGAEYWFKVIVPIALLAMLAVLPFTGIKSYQLSLATEILIFSMAAMGLNLLVGYTGLVSLGHGAFFGMAAYATAITAKYISPEIWLTFSISILFVGIVAVVVGWLALRLAGFYFLMITFAFTQIVYSAADKWQWLSGGTMGLMIRPARLFGKPIFASPGVLYYVALGAFLFTWLTIGVIVRSPFGQALVGIRENPKRMGPIGYHVRRYKIAAFVLAALFAGLGGAINGQFTLFVSPADVHWLFSGTLLIMVILGGTGTLYGPILGVAVYLYFQNWLSSFTDYWMFVVGALFIAFITGARKGLIGLGTQAWKQIWSKGA